ncbi:MAG: NACHT domain-containing protein, partial [Pseudanabaenaceae cyanobacterium bins.68]|nr:NACHT domain-containing protein [Pseudanabaenaceae cyanobacterium bins.68]
MRLKTKLGHGMAEKKIKAPLEVLKKANQALQGSPESLARELQIPLGAVHCFFAGDLVDQAIALKICKRLNILPKATGSSSLPEPKPELRPEPAKEKPPSFLPDHPLLDEVFATDDDPTELKFEILPDYQPIQSSPSPKGFTLLGDPEELEQIISPVPRIAQPRREQVVLAPPTIPELGSEPANQDLQDYQDHLAELGAEVRDRLTPLLVGRCEWVTIPGVSQGVKLAEVYIQPQFRSQPISDRWLGIHELEEIYQSQSLYSAVELEEENIDLAEVLAQYAHLIILGGVGIGKTTLLKYLALELVANRLLPERVPLLAELRLVAESGLSFQDFIWQYLEKHTGIDLAIANTLIKEGRFCLLLDGLDQVPATQVYRLTQQISSFAAAYPQNLVWITTRVAIAQQHLVQFKHIELAEFNFAQISQFSQQWFSTQVGMAERSSPLLHQLKGDRRLYELITTPLHLTLACIAYGASDFFTHDLFREALALLLHQWQASQGYLGTNSQLSTYHKAEILAAFAFSSLERQQYFFSRTQIQSLFAQIFREQTDLQFHLTDPEALIEQLYHHHGLLKPYARSIYGFSHRAWQEYLAAKWIGIYGNTDQATHLFKYVDQPAWHNVFTFVAGLLPSADQFLRSMQRSINSLVTGNSEVVKYLNWADQQATLLKAKHKPALIRAMYCDVDFEKMRVLDRNRALQIAHGQSLERARMRSLGIEVDAESDTSFQVNKAMEEAIELDFAMDFSKQRILSLARLLEPKMDRRLGWLGGQIPDPQRNQPQFMAWWQTQGGEWAKILRETILQYRKTIKDWEFNSA